MWKKLVTIEDKVNELARIGGAEKLKEVLMAYRRYLEEMGKAVKAKGVTGGDLFYLYRRHDRESR